MTHPVEGTVFVFGALRSGTTLFRLLLNSHPHIHNPGEVDFLFDFIAPDATHPTGWRFDLDALQQNRVFQARSLDLPPGLEGRDLLLNLLEQLAGKGQGTATLNVHRHADRIAQVLPKARFIHLVRDGRDVAYSSVGMGWSGTSWRGIDHWIDTEQHWDLAAIPDEKVLTLRFEDLIQDLEKHLGAVCAFLGVQMMDEMLRYHETSTYGPPDPKVAQQWKRRGSPREIALLESRAGDLLQARGYALSGTPHHPGALERAFLTLQDRLGRYRINIRRYGPGLFFQAHLARHLRLRGLQTRVQERMNTKTTEFLK